MLLFPGQSFLNGKCVDPEFCTGMEVMVVKVGQICKIIILLLQCSLLMRLNITHLPLTSGLTRLMIT